ncbi:hypothetical protein [Methylovorus sp. MP688]|uniref:hypothetical protein n=1 Tax=Methylovorus sp. (strain MP688) TaxID=887061 RepID=UPI0001EC45F2|nr:hypothetical protein [Methylovorus sp. MP688]ADQ84146.1 conserved hypothetical protein [Methylovorus sp. MP688]
MITRRDLPGLRITVGCWRASLSLIPLIVFTGIAWSPCLAMAASSLTIEADKVEAEGWQAKAVKLVLAPAQRPALALGSQIKLAKAQAWSSLHAECGQIKLPAGRGAWSCQQGLVTADRIRLPFNLTLDTAPVAGRPALRLDAQVQDAQFSDAAGLHAAEKLHARAQVQARQQAGRWLWDAAITWSGGELFWQPLYMQGQGQTLNAAGTWDAQALQLDRAALQLPGVATVQASGKWSAPERQWQTLHVDVPDMDLAKAYPALLKPMMEQSALGHVEMAGNIALKAGWLAGQLQAFQLRLRDVDMEDEQHRFAFYKLNADIPWDYDQPQSATMDFAGGHLLKVPLAASQLQAEVNRYALTAPELRLNILDGALVLSDVSAATLGGQWYWHLRANLTPLDMPELSTALGWPRMAGKVAASIPMVTYNAGTLTTDGVLGFNLFDGSISVNNLGMQTPLGSSPRLHADIEMRNLDLGHLTRTFSFGAIEGKLDGDIQHLELQNWQPVAFDAVLKSSPGKYPRKISQRAVENISALGGAGAAAAIQRSVLRFFDQFNYEKLGLSCRLHADVCTMDGVAQGPQGYVIVKGSGIPAITVMGYNRQVGWSELVSRIRRVTESNVKPVIQ